MPHPSPFSYRKRPVLQNEEVVGYFMVAFNDDPDHEYPFALYKDGTILPELDLMEALPKDRTMFARYLGDPTFHHLRYSQQVAISPDELEE